MQSKTYECIAPYRTQSRQSFAFFPSGRILPSTRRPVNRRFGKLGPQQFQERRPSTKASSTFVPSAELIDRRVAYVGNLHINALHCVRLELRSIDFFLHGLNHSPTSEDEVFLQFARSADLTARLSFSRPMRPTALARGAAESLLTRCYIHLQLEGCVGDGPVKLPKQQ